MSESFTIIQDEKCWMEHTAIRRLENVSKLPGIVWAVGLPDPHTGKNPIGITVGIEGILYPHLTRNDISCGMDLFKTSCALKKFKRECFVTKLSHIRALEDLPTKNPYPEESPIYNLGTIGGGNRFAEFQTVHEVLDGDVSEQLGTNKNQLLLLIHSGSREYGQRILSEFSGLGGLFANSERAQAYSAKHDDTLLWAGRDRCLVAEKLIGCIGYSQEAKSLLDCRHNFVERRGDHFIHRRGAVSVLEDLVVIPGSRDSLTYPVLPAADTSLSGHSLSHGAGREWARSLCKSCTRNKYERDIIRHSKLSSRTVYHDTKLLCQEVPEAYKNIEQMITALVEHGLCTVIATLRPLIAYRG